MRFYLSLIILVPFLSNCTNGTAIQQELEETKAALKVAQAELKELIANKNKDSGKLVHIVYLKLKPTANLDTVFAEIEKLKAIEVVEELEAGNFKDLGDQRALADYQVVMQMNFKDAAAYQKYQAHAIHLKLKEKITPLLAGPPATYDFVIQ